MSTGKDLAPAKPDSAAGIKRLIETYSVLAVAPPHIPQEAFVGMAVAYLRQDGKLQQAAMQNPDSFVMALRQIASWGHMPDKKHAALVWYNSRTATGGVLVEAIEMWKGVVQRIFRAGGVTAVHVQVGRENDRHLSWNPSRMRLPEHEYDEFGSPAERGALKAVWAWADMLGGGTSAVAWLNRHDVQRIREMSASVKANDAKRAKLQADGKAFDWVTDGGNFWGPPWPAEGPNTEPMWRKSALHRLEGIVPASPEYRWELAPQAPQAPPEPPEQPWRTQATVEVIEHEDGPQDGAEPAQAPPAGEAPAQGWPTVAEPGSGARKSGGRANA